MRIRWRKSVKGRKEGDEETFDLGSVYLAKRFIESGWAEEVVETKVVETKVVETADRKIDEPPATRRITRKKKGMTDGADDAGGP